MADRIVRVEGVEHRFPSDATDEEIQSALGQSKPTFDPSAFGRARLMPPSTAAHPIAEGGDEPSPLMESLSHVAKPQTPADFLGLALPSGIPPLARVAGKVPVRAIVKAGVQGVNKAASAAVNVAEHPVVSSAIGAGVGYAHSGLAGAIEGAVLGAPAGRVLRVLRKLAPTVEQTAGKRAAPQSLEQIVTALREEPAAAEAVSERTLRGGLSESSTQPGAFNAAMEEATKQPRQMMSQDEAGEFWRKTDFTKPTRETVPVSDLITTNEGLNPDVVKQYRTQPGAELPSTIKVGDKHIVADGHHHIAAQVENGATEIEVNSHPTRELTPAQLRQMERFGRKTPFTSEGGPGGAGPLVPVTLSQAVSAVRKAAKEAKLELSATEFTQGTQLRKLGYSDADIVDALKIQRQLKGSSSFANLPSDAEVRATVAAKNVGAGDRRSHAAQSGNPFR